MIDENGALYVPMQTDNSEFIGAINEAERRVKGFSDSTVEASSKINKALTGITGESVKMTNTFQGQARREVGLIADIEKELTILREKKRNAYTVEEIEKYNQKIQEAELNLKEYNDAGKKSVDTHQTLLQTISKWALGLGGAAAGLKVLLGAFKETTAGINLFNIVGAGTKQVLYDIVQGAGPSILKLREAVQLQRELNDLRLREYTESVEVARYNNQYQQLYGETLDATLSRSEKIAKIDDALAAHNKAIDLQVQNTKENLAIVEKSLLLQPNNEKMLKEYVDLLIKLENLDAERLSSTKRLIRQKSVLQKEEIDDLIAWREKMHKELQKLVDEENDLNEERKSKLRDIKNDIELGKLSGMDKELKALEQQYKIDLENYKDNEEIKSALTERYAQQRHEIELKYLEELKKANTKIAEEITKVDLGSGYTLLKRAITNKGTGPSFFGGTNNKPSSVSSLNSLIPLNPDIIEMNKKRMRDINESEKERIENALVLTDAMYQLTNILEEQGIITGDTAKHFQSIANIAMSVMTDTKINDEGLYVLGNPLGVAVGLMQTLMANIQQSFPSVMEKEAARLQSKIDEINGLLEYQQRLIDQSDRKGGQKEARQQEIDLLKAKIAEYEASIQRSREIMDSWHRSTKAKKEAFENITTLTEEVQNLKYELEDAEQAYNDFLTGGITENTIASAIIDGIEQGKIGADDFGLYMYDSIKQALQQAFMDQMMNSTLMKAYMNWFQQAMGEGGFTEAEAKQNAVYLEGMAKIWKDNYDAFMSGINSMPGMGEAEASKALSGSIKGVTEQTASLVAGQMNAMRITQGEMAGMMQQQLFHLSEIAANTRYNKYLEKIYENTIPISTDMRAQGL